MHCGEIQVKICTEKMYDFHSKYLSSQKTKQGYAALYPPHCSL